MHLRNHLRSVDLYASREYRVRMRMRIACTKAPYLEREKIFHPTIGSNLPIQSKNHLDLKTVKSWVAVVVLDSDSDSFMFDSRNRLSKFSVQLNSMETLVVSHQRNQHGDYGRNRSHTASNFGSFGSPPSSDFRGINCRTFHSETGSHPAPLKSCSMIPVINRAFSASFSPRTPPSSVYKQKNNSKSDVKSCSIPIPIKIEFENEERSFGDQLHFSERWAGPAYSNSPPPSSLPMPKFSLRPKRTVSLDLPSSASKIDLRHIAKSAPASPTRERIPFPGDLCEPSDSATSTLRRMLNLDISDE